MSTSSTSTALARLGYQLGAPAGLGGGGQVYRGRAPDGREVAIKVGHAADDAAAARAAREAAIMARLPPARFARVHSAGRLDDGRPWLAMEWIAGDTLAARLDDRPWPAAAVIELGTAIARALADAHALGVVHRDVKPENVMFRADGSIVLVDLGLARGPGDAATSATRCAGTPVYMAPEQVLGDAITPATDLYALGGILYRLLAGHSAFTGGALEIQLAHLGAPPAPLPAPADATTAALHALALRLLEKRPADRPASAAAVLVALARLTPRHRRLARVARATVATLVLAAALTVAALARPAPTAALAWQAPALPTAPTPAPAPPVLGLDAPWALVSAGDYTLRASWPRAAQAGDRVAVTVEVWDDETPIAPTALAATLRDPDGHVVALTGAALRSVSLAARGDYLLTVFAPDGDITLSVPIAVAPAPPS